MTPETAPPRRDWKAVGISIPGADHKAKGQSKQDYAVLSRAAEGPGIPETLLISVSDGASSAIRSQRGSYAAVAAVHHSVNYWRARTPHNRRTPAVVQRALQKAHRDAAAAVNALAARESRRPADYACTLISALAVSGALALQQTGDGGVILRDRQGAITLPLPPQKGRYHNETTFITDERTPKPLSLVIADIDITGIAAFTDGIENLLLDEAGSPHRPALEPLFGWADEINDENAARAELEQYWSRPQTTDRTRDDITLAIAVRLTG